MSVGEYINEPSYAAWHQRDSLARFGVGGAYGFDADQGVVLYDDDEPGEDIAGVTLEVAAFKGARKNKPPQVLMLVEAKCFDREHSMPTASDYSEFQLDSISALAKASGIPLYLVCYKHFDDDRLISDDPRYKGYPQAARDIEQFGTCLLWPQQSATELKSYTAEEYAKRLCRMRDWLTKFNAQDENRKARHEVYKLRDEMLTRWCAMLKTPVPSDRPWFKPETWARLPDKQRAEYNAAGGVTIADSDPIAADGKWRPRPEGSRWSRVDTTPRETAAIIQPAPIVQVWSGQGTPPPPSQVETANRVERRIQQQGETRGGRQPSGETR